MIGSMTKLPFYFFMSFLILSIPFKGESIYFHLNEGIRPYASKAYMLLQGQLNKTWHRGKKFGKQLFSNSVPKNVLPMSQEMGMGEFDHIKAQQTGQLIFVDSSSNLNVQ